MAETQIGKVIHWYDKAGVAVLSLTSSLAVGDRIKVARGSDEFEETVASMQVNHESVQSVKKGDEAAVKLSQRAKEGALVYKTS